MLSVKRKQMAAIGEAQLRNTLADFLGRHVDGLSSLREHDTGRSPAARSASIRHYTPKEQERLDEECRGYLHFMETSGVIDPATREVIIDRLMALETDEIALDQIKWVMLLVLFNQPGQEHAYHMLEDMVFDEMQGHLH